MSDIKNIVEGLHEEDAFRFIVECLNGTQRANIVGQASFASYGYAFYLPTAMRAFLKVKGLKDTGRDPAREIAEISSHFYSAAWNLCRRGILRPGISYFGGQATDDGSSGNGYSVTPFGEKWLKESDRDSYVPTEPERFAELLKRYSKRFGNGFQLRGQEAIRCYGAHAYLACCVMCGAAAESIMLAAAIAKKGDEDGVLKIYRTAMGRSQIQNLVLSQAKETMKTEFNSSNGLLKYWRDESGHGADSDISDNEAYTSLALLLRFAMFVHDKWDALTK